MYGEGMRLLPTPFWNMRNKPVQVSQCQMIYTFNGGVYILVVFFVLIFPVCFAYLKSTCHYIKVK